MQELLCKLNAVGIKLRAEGEELRVNAPTGVLSTMLRDELRLHKTQLLQLLRHTNRQSDEQRMLLQPDPGQRYASFPLTDLQHAYWVGRDSAVEMGNVATQLYVELTCRAIDMARLNEALRLLITRHDMLGAVINIDGTQRIMSEVPSCQIIAADLSTAQAGEIDRHIGAVREA